jgi:hypothetical protein
MTKWPRRKEVRRQEIAALREEGRAAALAGKHRQHYPQRYNGTMNLGHWLAGYDEAKAQQEAAAPSHTKHVSRERFLLTTDVEAGQQVWLEFPTGKFPPPFVVLRVETLRPDGDQKEFHVFNNILRAP